MNRGKKRMRLRDSSTDLRSRSATPSLSGSTAGTSAALQDIRSKARRALIMSITANLPTRDIEVSKPTPKPAKAYKVNCTPGGTLRVGEEVTVQQTPGGRVRNLPLSSNVLERIELFDEMQEDDMSSSVRTHVTRWLDGQVNFLAGPLSPSTAVEVDEQVNNMASLLSPSTTINTSRPDFHRHDSACIADVLPSTSGLAEMSGRVLRDEHDNGSDFDTDYDDEFDESNIENVGLPGRVRDIPDDDELDQPIREMIVAAQRTMDEEADRLGVSNIYNWEASFDSFSGVPERFTGPRPGPIEDYDCPYDAFIAIWTADIIDHIVRETNRYARETIDKHMDEGSLGRTSRLRQWRDTDADEIYTLFAVFMYMGIDIRTSQDEYWRTKFCLEMPRFRKIISYNRYVLLCKFLHFANNADTSQRHLQYGGIRLSPKVARIAPLLSHLDTKFSTLYNLSREISIDESLTLFKGRLSWVQAIRSKAARFGIKSYELCEAGTGYLYKFQIYTGKNNSVGSDDAAPSADLGGKSTIVVLDLLKGLENLGHSVTMDNFYNCPALSRYLKSKGFDSLGTLRVNRRHVPTEISKASAKVPKGTIIARQCGDVSILSWKDKKMVTMISTYHNDETYLGTKAGKTLVKPLSVRDYNNTMGGVDIKDQKLSMYLLERKRGVKWYIKIFKRLLNVSVHNAFIMLRKSLERREQTSLTHREFRYQLADTLVSRHRHGMPQNLEQVPDLMRLRRDILHCPKYFAGRNSRKRCIICQKQGKNKMIHTQCATCEVFLCFENCWKI